MIKLSELSAYATMNLAELRDARYWLSIAYQSDQITTEEYYRRLDLHFAACAVHNASAQLVEAQKRLENCLLTANG